MPAPIDPTPPWFVPGRPTPFAGGLNERRWKEDILSHVPAASAGSRHTGAHVRFVLRPSQDGGRGGDLDNLLDPVMSVVVNKLGWFQGRRPNLTWLAADKRFRGPTGAWIAPGAARPAGPAEPPLAEIIHDVYEGELPTSATDPAFADWVRERMTGVLGPDGRAAARLSFSSTRVNLGDMSTGKVKPLIDGLWPLLGGTPGAPEDWRIRDLMVEKGTEPAEGVRVWVAALPKEAPAPAPGH